MGGAPEVECQIKSMRAPAAGWHRPCCCGPA